MNDNNASPIWSVKFDDRYGDRPCYVAYIDSAFGDIKKCNDIRRAATYTPIDIDLIRHAMKARGYINPVGIINGHVVNRLLGIAEWNTS